METDQVSQASSHLFSCEEISTFAVLDGAGIPDLLEHLNVYQPDHVCLLRGQIPADLAQAAPYLVRLTAPSSFTSWLLSKGWTKPWGIFLQSHADIHNLRTHFRRLLIAQGPDGQPYYFRFYDPRVLGIFLSTCNAAERREIFGPVTAYIIHCDHSGTCLRFLSDSSEALCGAGDGRE